MNANTRTGDPTARCATDCAYDALHAFARTLDDRPDTRALLIDMLANVCHFCQSHGFCYARLNPAEHDAPAEGSDDVIETRILAACPHPRGRRRWTGISQMQHGDLCGKYIDPGEDAYLPDLAH